MEQYITIGNTTYKVSYFDYLIPYNEGIIDTSEIIEIVKILDISIFPGESGLPEDTVMVKFDNNNNIIMEVSKI